MTTKLFVSRTDAEEAFELIDQRTDLPGYIGDIAFLPVTTLLAAVTALGIYLYAAFFIGA